MKQRRNILIIGAAVLVLLLVLLLPGDRFLAADSDARNLSPGRTGRSNDTVPMLIFQVQK